VARPAFVARAGDRRLLTGAASPARIFSGRDYFRERKAFGLAGSGKVYLTRTKKQTGPCQVGSETERPCPNRATVEIQGIPFCEKCAREQEAYFEVGRRLTHAREDRELTGAFF
jgi:hypothetical protein